MKFTFLRPIMLAITTFALASAPALAYYDGQVTVTVRNFGTTPAILKLATNCFTDTPHQYWNGAPVPPGANVFFSADESQDGSCLSEVSTFNLWFTTPQGSGLATYNIGMSGPYSVVYGGSCPTNMESTLDLELDYVIVLNGNNVSCNYTVKPFYR
jgi:hypothetical protein